MNKMTENQLNGQLKKQMMVNIYLDNRIGKVEATEQEIQAAMYKQYKQQPESQKQKVKHQPE